MPILSFARPRIVVLPGHDSKNGVRDTQSRPTSKWDVIAFNPCRFAQRRVSDTTAGVSNTLLTVVTFFEAVYSRSGEEPYVVSSLLSRCLEWRDF